MGQRRPILLGELLPPGDPRVGQLIARAASSFAEASAAVFLALSLIAQMSEPSYAQELAQSLGDPEGEDPLWDSLS